MSVASVDAAEQEAIVGNKLKVLEAAPFGEEAKIDDSTAMWIWNYHGRERVPVERANFAWLQTSRWKECSKPQRQCISLGKNEPTRDAKT